MNSQIKFFKIISISALIITPSLPSHSAVPIDQSPIQVRNPVNPNILFILDDSGSMDWNYMPDSISSNCSSVNYSNFWGSTSSTIDGQLNIFVEDDGNSLDLTFSVTGTNFTDYIQSIEVDVEGGSNNSADWLWANWSSGSGVTSGQVSIDLQNNDDELDLDFNNNSFVLGESFVLNADVQDMGDNRADQFADDGVTARVRVNNTWSSWQSFTASGDDSTITISLDTEVSNSDPVYCKSSTYNKVYYNPNTTYTPPVNSNAQSLGNSSISAAWTDGFSLDSEGDHNSSTSNISGWEYYEFDTDNCDINSNSDLTTQTCYSHTAVADLNSDGQTNFANWYSYYRTRLLTAKSGISLALSNLNSDYRFGYGQINNGSSSVSGVNSTLVSGVEEFQNIKAEFYEWLFDQNASGSTPLRRALDAAGTYYTTDAPYYVTPGSASSGTLSCRQNFTILMTDGYWNGNTVTVGNVDGSAGTDILSSLGETFTYSPASPFNDNYSNTLADIAMHYWKNDLKTDSNFDNDVPVSDSDPAFWQHMVTLGIGLGVTGDVSPDEAFLAIDSGDSIIWGNPSNNGPEKIDDLLHAAVNSRGSFFAAQDPSEFASGLGDAIATVTSRIFAGTSPAVNSARTEGDRYLYRASYGAGDWSGTLTAATIDPESGDIGVTAWSASFPQIKEDSNCPSESETESDCTYINDWVSRNIFTTGSTSVGGGISFHWDSVDQAIKDGLALSDSATDDDIQEVINFLKGDPTNEISEPNGGSFRDRYGRLLGDIVNSSPLFVSNPITNSLSSTNWTEASTHNAFASTNAARSHVIYAGANDGLLHAFNAETGLEMFSYIPRELLTRSSNNLNLLTLQNYEHKYFTDGSTVVADAYFDGAWHTVLVGTTGRGGKSMFALDITDPDNFGADDVLWDITVDSLGNNIGKPVITKLQNGDWAVITGNGYNSVSETAQLIAIRLSDGATVSIDTGVGSESASNGLSGALVWDSDTIADQLSDKAYAGDLLGNVWEFDLSSLDFDGTNNITPTKLFTAVNDDGDYQPITASMTGSQDTSGQLWLHFGTGRFLSSDDVGLTSSTSSGSNSLPINQSFASGTEGWSNASTQSGELRINSNTTASQTFEFGTDYANQTVTISFSLDFNSEWENTGTGSARDYFRVRANGSTLTQDAQPSSVSLTATTDSNGDLDLDLITVNSANNEYALVDNFSITSNSTTSSTNVLASNVTLDDNSAGNSTSNGATATYSFTVASGDTASLTILADLQNPSSAGDNFSWTLSGTTNASDQTTTEGSYSSTTNNLQPGSYTLTLIANDLSTSSDWITFQTNISSIALTTFTPSTSSGTTTSNESPTQSWYGIKAIGSFIDGRATLKERVIDSVESSITGTDHTFTIRTIEGSISGDMDGKTGWYIDLPAAGERIVVPNVMRSGALLGTTIIPDITDCGSATDGYILAINPYTGARLSGDGYFDFTGDGNINSSDQVDNPNGDGQIAGSGFSIGDSTSTPIFVGNQLVAQTSEAGTVVVEIAGGDSVQGTPSRISWREIKE